MDNETLKNELLTMPKSIKEQALKVWDKTKELGNERRKLEITEAGVAGKVASNQDLSNETKRKAEKLRLLAENENYNKLRITIPVLEQQLKEGEIELQYLRDQFSALKTIAEMQRFATGGVPIVQ